MLLGILGKYQLYLPWLGWIWVVVEGIGSLCAIHHIVGDVDLFNGEETSL